MLTFFMYTNVTIFQMWLQIGEYSLSLNIQCNIVFPGIISWIRLLKKWVSHSNTWDRRYLIRTDLFSNRNMTKFQRKSWPIWILRVKEGENNYISIYISSIYQYTYIMIILNNCFARSADMSVTIEYYLICNFYEISVRNWTSLSMGL